MQDTPMNIIGIIVAAILMFIIPVIIFASKNDEIAQTVVETVVSDFVTQITQEGKITSIEYEQLLQKLAATGNSYDVQIEVQIMDDNPRRATTTKDNSVIGENKYYSVYTNNIIEKLNDDKTGNEYQLKTDDYVIVTVKNTNVTMGTQIKGILYKFVGKDTYTIGTSEAGLVLNGPREEILGEINATPQKKYDETPLPEGIQLLYDANLPIKGEIIAINNVPETQDVEEGIPTSVSMLRPEAVTTNQFVHYIFMGWSLRKDPIGLDGKANIDYKPGDTIICKENKTVYGVWKIALSKMNWIKDLSSDVSNIIINETTDIVNEEQLNTIIEMTGNRSLKGKGAIWTEFKSENMDISSYTFNYYINKGDSFSAAGFLFDIKDYGTYLQAYVFCINFLGGPATRGPEMKECNFWHKAKSGGAIFKITYKKNENRFPVQQENIELIETLPIDIPQEGEKETSGKGTITIKATDDGGYTLTGSEFKQIYKLPAYNKNPNSFGFLSDHYSHNCSYIGYFKIDNMMISVKEK